VRDDSGKLFIFANGDITLVCNQSRGAISTVVEMGVPPGADIAKVRDAIDAAAKEVYERQASIGFTKAPEFLGVGGGDSTRTIVRIIVEVDDPGKLGAAATAIRDAAHSTLLAAGITPF